MQISILLVHLWHLVNSSIPSNQPSLWRWREWSWFQNTQYAEIMAATPGQFPFFKVCILSSILKLDEPGNWFSITAFSFNRLEKDIRFNYFWTRCTKLVLVSFHPILQFLYIQTKNGGWIMMYLRLLYLAPGNSLCCTLCWMLQLSHCWPLP